MHALHWEGHGYFVFESASTLVCDMYVDTVKYVVPVFAGNSVLDFVEDDDNWSLDDTLLSRNADVRTSLGLLTAF